MDKKRAKYLRAIGPRIINLKKSDIGICGDMELWDMGIHGSCTGWCDMNVWYHRT